MIRLEDKKRSNLYQWDLNMRLVLTGVPAGTEVHFSDKYNTQNECPVLISYEENGNVYVNIPNIFLQKSGVITAYIYIKEENRQYTEHCAEILVLPRKKPADYVYTPEELKTWESLEKRVKKIEDEGCSFSGKASDVIYDDSNTQLDTTNVQEAIGKVSEQKVDKNALSLGFGTDGKLYIMVSGLAIGDGVEIDGTVTPSEPSEGVAVFVADFSGESPSPLQFYTWEGRTYDMSYYDALENIECVDGVANLTSVYDSENSRWIKQMMCTGGLFESDNFTCKFKAKFCGLAGSWNNVITYGTGTHWTNAMYSDGVKWPAGGEIDAFEQAGGYSETPNKMSTPTAYWGSGTNSGYPNTHLVDHADGVEFTPDEWHDFKFSLQNGYVKIWIDDVLIGEKDFSYCTVDNNYLYDYKPFMKPQAFYIDGSCCSNSSNPHTDYEYNFEVSDFEIYQDTLVECTGLEIYPQMWEKGTNLIFPVGAELYLDRIYTPSNVSNKACTWKSSDESVATVVQGFVKTLKEGTATITATCGNASATYSLTVNNTNANIPCVKVVADESVSLVKGKTFDVKSYLYPKFTTEDVAYSSNNNNIATFENGVIKGVEKGQTTVVISCGTKSAVVSVDVLEGATPVIAYDLSVVVNNYEPYTGETTTLPNVGSYGSSFDGTLTQFKTNYDGDGNYSVDGYIKNMKLTADVTGLNLNKVAHTVVYRGVKVSNGLAINQLFNSDSNKMPSINNNFIKYGNVDGYSYTFTEEITNIAVSSDGTTAKLFINGTLVMSGSDGYSASNPTALTIQNINGNIESFEIYMEQLSDAELIEITSIS